ncbi:hypothetical protein C0993_006167 [Termitomyces sp. T159_Od127]|nr:hypothetical protein C0993_006167 [Termitomyces sp. T159_Od127]
MAQHASCMLAKQEWALEWLLGQMEGGSKLWAAGKEALHPREGGEEQSSESKEEEEEKLASALVVKVGPPRRQRPLVVACGKWQVFPSLEGGPSEKP